MKHSFSILKRHCSDISPFILSVRGWPVKTDCNCVFICIFICFASSNVTDNYEVEKCIDLLLTLHFFFIFYLWRPRFTLHLIQNGSTNTKSTCLTKAPFPLKVLGFTHVIEIPDNLSARFPIILEAPQQSAWRQLHYNILNVSLFLLFQSLPASFPATQPSSGPVQLQRPSLDHPVVFSNRSIHHTDCTTVIIGDTPKAVCRYLKTVAVIWQEKNGTVIKTNKNNL